MLSIPAIQLGYSYYVSVAFVLFIYCFLMSVKAYGEKIYFGITLACICFLTKAAINSVEAIDLRETLIPLREMVCFLALIFISLKVKNEMISQDFLNKLILLLLLLILTLVVQQSYAVLAGTYYGIPIEYFVSNRGTLDGVENALFYQTRFRPTSFFGEPSYTSFIVLSLLIVSYGTLKTLKNKIFFTTLALSIVTISQSLAGILSVVFVALYWMLFSKLSNIRSVKKLILTTVFFLFAAASLYLSEEIYVRIGDALAGRDASLNTRINEPLSLLIDVISSGSLFGVNFQYIEKFLGYTSLDNAVLRIFIYYGVLAVIPLTILLIHSGSGILGCYIALTMSFNGELFSYDKALIVGMVIGLAKVKFINTSRNDFESPRAS